MARVPHGVPLTPTEGDDPFAAIRAAHVPWASGELPDLDVALGIRTSHEQSAGTRTVLAYRAWATRAGSQQAAFAGEGSWTPERRFDRLFERLALPGLGRPGRYELLVSLGRLGVVDVRPSTLQLTDDATTVAAKRVFGIGDKMLLERRARDLADAVGAADRGARSRAVQLGGAAARARDDGLDGPGGARRRGRYRIGPGRLDIRTSVRAAAQRLNLGPCPADHHATMNARMALIKQLVDDGGYPLDEHAVAEAILVRSMARRMHARGRVPARAAEAAGALVPPAPRRALVPPASPRAASRGSSRRRRRPAGPRRLTAAAAPREEIPRNVREIRAGRGANIRLRFLTDERGRGGPERGGRARWPIRRAVESAGRLPRT